jgi:hypothetical protein
MNIELLIDDVTPLVLGDDIRVQLVRQNNFWREDVAFSFEFSEPFDIPYCQINAQLLGNPEDINARRRTTRNITMRVKKQRRLSGVLVVLDASRDGYTIALVRKSTDDLSKKLSEVVSLTYSAPTPETDMPNQVAAGTTNDFNWPQIADTSETQMQKFPINVIWYWTYINYYHGTAENFDTDTPLAPQFFLKTVVNEVAKYYGWKIFSPWLRTAKIKNKMLFNTNSILVPQAYDRYFKIAAIPSLYGQLYLSVVTPYDGSTYTDYRPYIGDQITLVINRFNTNTFVLIGTTTVNYTIVSGDIGNLNVFFTNLLTAIVAVDANYAQSHTNFLTNNPGIMLKYVVGGVEQILYPTTTLGTATEEDTYQAITPASTNYSIEDILMANHMPDITVAEFFTGLKDMFNLAVFPDNRTGQVYIVPKKELLSARSFDATKYILANPVTSEIELPKYKIKYEIDEFEVYEMSDLSYYDEVTLLAAYLDPTNSTEINVACGRPFAPEYGFPNGNAGQGAMPVTEFEIGFYESLVSNPFRLITWKGLQHDSLATDYPKADMEDLNPDELFNDWWLDWINYVTSDPRRIRAKLRIPIEVLNTISPLMRWRIRGIEHIWIELVEIYTQNDIEIEAKLARI